MVIKSDSDMLETNGHLHWTRLDALFQISYSYFFRKKWPKIKYFDFSDLGVVGLPKASGNFASLKWVVVSLPKASGKFFLLKWVVRSLPKVSGKFFSSQNGLRVRVRVRVRGRGRVRVRVRVRGSKIPTKGPVKIFFISKRSQKGSSRPGKGPLNFFFHWNHRAFPRRSTKNRKIFRLRRASPGKTAGLCSDWGAAPAEKALPPASDIWRYFYISRTA